MPSAAIVRAAIFTAGAVVGGCVATAVSHNRNRPVISPVTPKSDPPQPVNGYDATTISGELTIASNLLPVLKYGNPGVLCPSNF